jgi:hypothetical protein
MNKTNMAELKKEFAALNKARRAAKRAGNGAIPNFPEAR